MMEACDGSVSGTCAMAWENSTPRAERASRCGVFAPCRALRLRWTSITAEVVGTCGVERDQEDVGVSWREARVVEALASPAAW